MLQYSSLNCEVTVLVDGQRINSCLALAVQYQDREVVTIEGLGAPGSLHPLQKAFVEHDGFQCSDCTLGQICLALGMVDELTRGIPSYVTENLTAETASAPRLTARRSTWAARAKPGGKVNAHYGRDPIVKIYTTITDRYAPFHQTVIAGTAGEAVHALDGILGHDSGIDISALHVDGGTYQSDRRLRVVGRARSQRRWVMPPRLPAACP